MVAFKILVWSLFPLVGAFSHKFSIAPSGKTTDRLKSITMPSMMGIVGRAPAVDKRVMFFVRFFVCHALEL